MEMFTSFKKVMADPEITTAGKSVFLNLLSRMDKKGYCYPAVNTMEDETGYCERTIQRTKEIFFSMIMILKKLSEKILFFRIF